MQKFVGKYLTKFHGGGGIIAVKSILKEHRMEDLISVIVPVYKVEKFLRKCIESIVNQTYKNLEIILVDDGSPDGCPEICDEYARRDPRIKVVHKTNGGLSDARNAGLAEAEGEFIGFVDSDDFIEAEMYRKLLCALKENDADMAVCNEICVDENSARMELVLYSRPYGILSKEDALKEVAQGIFPSVAWNKLYRRKIFGKVKFIRGKCHEDEFFLHEIVFQCEKIVTISDRLYFYTVGRKGSITAEFSINRFDGVEAMCCRYKFFEEKGLDDLLPSAKNLVIAVWADRRGKFFPRTKSRRLRVREIDRMVKEICIPTAKSGGKSVSVKTKIKFAFPFFYSLWVRFRIFPRARKIAALLKYALRFRCRYVLLQTPLHGNLGDQAIILAEKEFLKRLPRGTFAELPSELTLFHEKLFARFTPKNRIVLITGGGFLGCLWPDEEFAFRRNLQAFSKNKIIVFPQTVTFDTKTSGGKEFFEESRRIYEGHGNLTIFVREKESLSFMQENMNVKTFLRRRGIISGTGL